MKKKETKAPPAAFWPIARRIIALVMILWLAAVGLLTWAVARDLYMQMESKVDFYLGRVTHRYISAEEESLPGAFEKAMIQSLCYPYLTGHAEQLLPEIMTPEATSISSDDWIWGKWELIYGYEAAVSYYDTEGNKLIDSGNYMMFTYTSEEQWLTQEPQAQGLAYIDADAAEGTAAVMANWFGGMPGMHSMSSLFYPLIRTTGWFEGNEFHPVSMEFAPDAQMFAGFQTQSLHGMTPQQLSKLNLQWEPLFESEDVPDRELVTLYGWDVESYSWRGKPVTVDGVEYQDISCLPKAYLSKEGLTEALVVQSIRDSDQWGDYVICVAIRCHPLQYAMLRLLPVYLVSLAVVALSLFLVLRAIRRRLLYPIADILWGSEPDPSVKPWLEPVRLNEQVTQYRQSAAEGKIQVQQLQTALEYAQNAEENRRAMISALTHELKTPLAVIHGYAEGLQSGIAAKKQEEYISVILEETEAMDAMVMQMLDLSRLEAGKVRLAADRFSLLALTKSVVQRLELSAAEKNLTITFETEEDFLLTADESRIRQVIVNLLSNAIRYTDAGGQILLSICREGQSARFTISNTAQPLSPEALGKVFEPFYRADPSRTKEGTGLGLAIVRQIMLLHQGGCSVRNIYRNGVCYVTFSVSLPID